MRPTVNATAAISTTGKSASADSHSACLMIPLPNAINKLINGECEFTYVLEEVYNRLSIICHMPRNHSISFQHTGTSLRLVILLHARKDKYLYLYKVGQIEVKIDKGGSIRFTDALARGLLNSNSKEE